MNEYISPFLDVLVLIVGGLNSFLRAYQGYAEFTQNQFAVWVPQITLESYAKVENIPQFSSFSY
jgi:hypothetical protein